MIVKKMTLSRIQYIPVPYKCMQMALSMEKLQVLRGEQNILHEFVPFEMLWDILCTAHDIL